MVDPFSILLNAGVSWFTGKVLDAILDCFKCYRKFPEPVRNREINHFSCPSCDNILPQYVNACYSTYDKDSNRVGVAGIPNIWWGKWGGSI